jgi:hypothetical protein
MKVLRALQVLFIGVALIALTASPARAQNPKVEIGTSLASATIGLGDIDQSTLGVPSAGFNLLSPTVYASIFVGSRLAIEPQLGLVWATSHGDSFHFLNVAGQVDYFIRGTNTDSPYVFGIAGLVDVSGSNSNPKTVGAGAGYRILAGDRLSFRFDGRFMHFTDDGGDVVGFALSIGGLFGR